MAQEPDPDHKKLQYPPDFNAYRILDEIGVGVSAVVYKAICIPMNSTVAIKSIDLDQSRADFDTIRLETKTMSLLFHPNILESHCSFTVDRRLWVVMPFMSAGSLQSIISSAFPDGLPEPCIAAVLKETLNAVSYLHNQGHLHRDIKAGNILIDSNGHVKLADFGVSASIYEPKIAKGGNFLSSCSPRLMLTDLAGTPYWMAPEVIHSHTGYSFKADIWSFGITAMELAHGCPPLSHLPPSKSMLMKITKRFRFSDYEKHKTDKNKKFSKAFKDMVASCLDQDPSKRPSADKLLRHSFFKNCKGLEFLVKNLLHGLPSVEERFKQSRGCCVGGSGGEGEDEKEIGGGLKGQIVKNRRISGWNFNEAGFELDPIFPTESREDDDTVVKQVRFRGETETIIHDRKFEFGDSSESGGSSLNSLGWAGDESQVGGAHGGDVVAEGIGDRERMLGGLIALRMSLDMQRMNVVNLINVLGGEVVTSDDDEELMRANENLRFELENEKEKNYALGLELEILKLLVSNAYNPGVVAQTDEQICQQSSN